MSRQMRHADISRRSHAVTSDSRQMISARTPLLFCTTTVDFFAGDRLRMVAAFSGEQADGRMRHAPPRDYHGRPRPRPHFSPRDIADATSRMVNSRYCRMRSSRRHFTFISSRVSHCTPKYRGPTDVAFFFAASRMVFARLTKSRL